MEESIPSFFFKIPKPSPVSIYANQFEGDTIPTPKISDILFNSGFNCALPHLFRLINQLAKSKVDAQTQFPNFENFKLFKRCFEDFYFISELSWADFNNFIHRFNFADLELIFAPVIRRFITINLTIEDQIRRFSDITDNPLRFFVLDQTARVQQVLPGRYYVLPHYEIDIYFYRPFGLSMSVQEWNREQGSYTQVYSSDHVNRTTINLYCYQGQYELKAHDHLEASLVISDHVLNIIHQQISESKSRYETNIGLSNLFMSFSTRVNERQKALISFNQYFDLASQRKIFSTSEDGNFSFAINLLLLMRSDVPTELGDYAAHNLKRLADQNFPSNIRSHGIIMEVNKIIEQGRVPSRQVDYSGLSSDPELNIAGVLSSMRMHPFNKRV